MILKEFANVLKGEEMATVAAAGSTAADAAALSAQVTTVTGADATKGVILPAGDGELGTVLVVYSSAATNALKVYPPDGESINAGAADAAVSLVAQKPALFVRVSSTQWLCVASDV